jgi:hypothetical protein
MAEVQKNRWLWPVVFAIAIVALAALALTREPVMLDPETPEGTVQAYLQAIGDHDYQAALEYLDPTFYEGCMASDIAAETSRQEPFSATLDETSTESIDANNAFVSVRMQFGTTGPLGNGWTNWESFTLIKVNGTWLITENVWPYFSWACAEGNG